MDSHAWIHLTFKLPIKKWQTPGSDNVIVAQNKVRIQTEFEKMWFDNWQTETGIWKYQRWKYGKAFFNNEELSAEITKIDINLIKILHVIMIAVYSGYEIDVDKFWIFTHMTASYFVKKYPWYNMPPILHKYFIHGPEIILSALLPIGQLTGKVQAACDKDFKKFREHNARKCSREKTNNDIFNHFLVS